MDLRERIDDNVEAVRAAQEGHQAQIWTAMPGIVQSYDAGAQTCTVQPAVKGKVESPDGSVASVTMPLLVDVPVIFPCGGGFTCTFPIAVGDECLIVFASRCIDGWWQSGGVQEAPSARMHDLSDGFAIVGPRSQARKLSPSADAENVQLRTDDGKATITIKPDMTIRAENPTSSVELSPEGTVVAKADTEITLRAPAVRIETNSFSMTGYDGGAATAHITGDIVQDGSHTSTGDQVAGTISQLHHGHKLVQPGTGTSGEPV